jgi:hypothetical protein
MLPARVRAVAAAHRLDAELGEAEVEDLDQDAGGRAALGDEEDVVGLEVAVNDPGGVRGADRLRHLPHDDGGEPAGEPTFATSTHREALALEELHHQVGRAARVRAEVEDLA